MSELFFPNVAGLTFEIKPSPTWATDKQRSRNGATTRLMADPYPLWTFELTYEFLRDCKGAPSTANPKGYSELQQIVGFFNARGGEFDSFLLDPGMLTGRPRDNEVHGVTLGVGDGVATTFYLVRDAGGFLDEVQAPIGTVYVSVDGVPQTSGWTLGDAGAVVFAAAPAAGKVVTADFRWAWRVCFAEGSLGLEGFMFELYELKSLKLEQVKV